MATSNKLGTPQFTFDFDITYWEHTAKSLIALSEDMAKRDPKVRARQHIILTEKLKLVSSKPTRIIIYFIPHKFSNVGLL